jgi:hypothetical protein
MNFYLKLKGMVMQMKKTNFVKITYDLKRSNINYRKFECNIFQVNDDYFLVEFDFWFSSFVDDNFSTKYFKCDTFDGLKNLLSDLGLTEDSNGYIL